MADAFWERTAELLYQSIQNIGNRKQITFNFCVPRQDCSPAPMATRYAALRKRLVNRSSVLWWNAA